MLLPHLFLCYLKLLSEDSHAFHFKYFILGRLRNAEFCKYRH